MNTLQVANGIRFGKFIPVNPQVWPRHVQQTSNNVEAKLSKYGLTQCFDKEGIDIHFLATNQGLDQWEYSAQLRSKSNGRLMSETIPDPHINPVKQVNLAIADIVKDIATDAWLRKSITWEKLEEIKQKAQNGEL